KFVYKIYYLDGQDVVYLDTYGGYYKIDNGDQTYYNKVFIHYVETTNKAPEGEKLFLSIYFKAQIEASWSNNDLETDFKDGANKIILQEFTFYKLVYYEDPIGPWE
ncbi:MAG: hypothetical protein KAR35_02675, partial [Candidatus Heimdallarchaeota archaeon]|nr:hypothetical protein [Candidatus Heimdallarchaeota archaeon]MCK5048259.1 hypothetical protein [Candidatus Heimdallarchaeota archaeon]